MTNIMFSFCSLKPCCHLFFWWTLDNHYFWWTTPPPGTGSKIRLIAEPQPMCGGLSPTWNFPHIPGADNLATTLYPQPPSILHDPLLHHLIRLTITLCILVRAVSKYWCSSSCWAFCRGHGSSGPRRIKGNFMEIGFIHRTPLCATVVLQSKRAR